MKKDILPINFPEVSESIYAGFWRRLGALILDALIVIIISRIITKSNSEARINYFYTLIPAYIFHILYSFYTVKRWGGTPGKLICGVIIQKQNGQKVGWREVILREIIQFCLSLFGVITHMIFLIQMTDAEFLSLTGRELVHRKMEQMPLYLNFSIVITQIWIWSEFIVLLLNKRKRALHDFIAGTVIIKKKYQATAEQWASSDAAAQRE